MAYNRQLSTLRTRCQQRCDKEYDGSITESEWDSLMSESYGELHGIVADAGMRYFESTSSLTATGATSYSAPSDMLAIVRVDFLEQGSATGTRRTLQEIMTQEQERWSGQTGEAYAFALADDQIYLYPNPSSGSYQVVYIPQPDDLATYDDSDNVDLISSHGERFLIWCTAVKALAKSESDVTLAMTERDAARKDLQEWAVMRAFNQPRRRVVREGPEDMGSPYWDPGDWWHR